MEQKLISFANRLFSISAVMASFFEGLLNLMLKLKLNYAIKVSGVLIIFTIPFALWLVWQNVSPAVLAWSPVPMDELAWLSLQSPFLIGGLLFYAALWIFYPVVTIYLSLVRNTAQLFVEKEETK